LINWLIKKHKQKRLSKLQRKRRIFEHQAGPLVDELYMKHQIRAYEIKFAKIGQQAPEQIRGLNVEILYFSRFQCEVKFIHSEEPSFFIQTNQLDLSPIQSANDSGIGAGEFVKLLKDIHSDDEVKEVLGEAGEELLIIRIEEGHDFPYWVYNGENKEAFRVNKSEMKRLDKRIQVEII
jgi:hypothetical protein